MSDKNDKQIQKSSKDKKNIFSRFISMIINWFKSVVAYFKSLKAELKRITWPNKKEVKKSLSAVVVFCCIYIVLVSILDAVFVNLFKLM